MRRSVQREPLRRTPLRQARRRILCSRRLQHGHDNHVNHDGRRADHIVQPSRRRDDTDECVHWLLRGCFLHCLLQARYIRASAVPKSFDLGKTDPLATGQHTVDYYKYTGVALDVTQPDASYSWSIVAATTTATTSTATTTTAATTTAATTTATTTTAATSTATVTALASLPYPVPTAIAGAGSPKYNANDTVVGADGITRLAPAADPGGSGRQVYLHRIVRADASTNSTVRSEKLWIDSNQYLFPGNDYWFAFAVRPKSDEYPVSTSSTDNNMLIWQVHSESTGATQNDLGLYHDIGLNRAFFNRAWGSSTQATTTDGTSKDWIGPYPKMDVWTKYIVHFRPGYLASHSPRTEVWQAVGTGPYTKIVSAVADTDFNTYNWNTGSYPRIGMYKWSGTTWSTTAPTIAAYFTTLYMAKGADKYNEAVAALAGL